jgi:CrcB protein
LETFTRYLAVALGGAIGACLRYYIGGSAVARAFGAFPTATFIINITGSFIIGFFLTLATEKIMIDPHVRLTFAVGFVGAYTTFSTFEYETARLIEEKQMLIALLNVILSVVVGFVAVWGGIIAARELEGAPWTGRIMSEQSARPTDLRQSDSHAFELNAKDGRDERDDIIQAQSEDNETLKVERL